MRLFLPLLFVSLTWSLNSNAADDTSCPDYVERRGSIQLQSLPSPDGLGCFVSVHNRKAENLTYRDYLFTEDGEFMVFVSLGPGDESKTTGAREFFFFPRRQKFPSYAFNDETHRLEVTSATGDVFYFDYEDAELTHMTNGRVQKSTEIVATNRGGIEIQDYQGLKLDSGFRLGGAPTVVRAGKASFTDSKGKSCNLKNQDLFKYTSDGDAIFKFSDQGLATLLKSKCPSLTFPKL